ncbi:hypothetical protein WJX81_000123 [Elliptochloris bilobata]|uniref:Rubisco LSMT substrate-binding domain-containing protein n=1 Tax=Elliptochloris bilobata TaxID=381761 RepID=A0AAW1QYS3_9CHLO
MQLVTARSVARGQPLVSVLLSVQGYRQFFEAKYAELDAGLLSQHRDVFPADMYSYDRFLWAVGTVRARTHAPLDGAASALVPLADLAAHRRGAPQWRAGGGLFGRGQAVTLEAERDYAAGELVDMDYGAGKLDSQVLLDHGVLDADSPQGGFVLNLELPPEDRFFDDKADILEQSGLTTDAQFTLLVDREPSEQLLGFLRLLNLSGMDAFLLEPLFRNEAWGFMLAPVSEANERAVYQSMADGCRAALQGYAGGIEADLRAARSTPPGSRLAMAVQVRLGEKEALDSTLRWFEARADRIASLEFYQERRLKTLGLLDDDGASTYDTFFKDGIA